MPSYSRSDSPQATIELTDLSTGIDELAVAQQDLVIPVVTLGSAEHTLNFSLDEAVALQKLLDEVAEKMAEAVATQTG